MQQGTHSSTGPSTGMCLEVCMPRKAVCWRRVVGCRSSAHSLLLRLRVRQPQPQQRTPRRLRRQQRSGSWPPHRLQASQCRRCRWALWRKACMLLCMLCAGAVLLRQSMRPAWRYSVCWCGVAGQYVAVVRPEHGTCSMLWLAADCTPTNGSNCTAAASERTCNLPFTPRHLHDATATSAAVCLLVRGLCVTYRRTWRGRGLLQRLLVRRRLVCVWRLTACGRR